MTPYHVDPDYRDENEGSIITSLISQLKYVYQCCFVLALTYHLLHLSPQRVGMDLSRVTFPTFVLEPRSMLERITDFMSHPDLIFGQADFVLYSCTSSDFISRAEHCNDPEERFIRVLQYYLSGWHIKPKGVKKP